MEESMPYGGWKKLNMECGLLFAAKIHLALCSLFAWLVIVLLLLAFVLGFIGSDDVDVSTSKSTPGPVLPFLLGGFLMWILVASVGSLMILYLYYGHRRRLTQREGG